MEFRNLRTFYYASIFLNFSRTAEYLNFSQPTVTAQIHNLEEEMGFQLFYRVGRNTYLTPAGEKVKEYAKKILSMVDDLEEEMQLLLNPSGKLSIAAYETFCTTSLQPIICRFSKRHPQVNIRIIACNSDKVINGIEKNEFDVGVISGVSENSNIRNIELGEDPIILVASKKCTNKYSKEQLISELPLIRYMTGGSYGELLERYISINNLKNERSIEFSSLEAVKSAAMHNIGIALISRDVVSEELSEGSLVEIITAAKEVSVKTSVIFLKNKNEEQSVQKFCELIKEMWNKER